METFTTRELVLRRGFVGGLEVGAGAWFTARLGVVVGLDGKAVLVGSAWVSMLSGGVEDHAAVDMAPDLGPPGVEVASQASWKELAADLKLCWLK